MRGLIGFDAGNLTGADSTMMVGLKGLPEALRGGAWPPSACAVRCPVKSGNRRDPRPQLRRPKGRHTAGTAGETRRKVRATAGMHAPNAPGYTRASMGGTGGRDPERGSKSPNPLSVQIEGCNSPS